MRIDGLTFFLCKTLTFGIFLTLILGYINEGEKDDSLVCHDGYNWKDDDVKCIQVAIKFLQQYLKALRRNSIVDDYCSQFLGVSRCFERLEMVCPDLKIPERLISIIRKFQCTCNMTEEYKTTTYNCQNDLICFESQVQSLLGERCDGLYRFNLQQNVVGKCILKEEHIRCREALVSSACGKHVGDFSYNLSLQVMHKPDKCPMIKKAQYDGFQYTESCTIEFPREMEKCELKYLKRNLLKFSQENDLIAVASEKSILRSCRNFLQYDECINTVKISCPDGVNIIYGYDFVLRLYVLKMKYICHETSLVYIQQIKCLNKVLKDESLAKCNYIFDDLLPVLNSSSAFEFYCEPKSDTTVGVKGYLQDLDVCYGNVFTQSCDINTSIVMTGLLRHAFLDPFYLRYIHEPDCSLLDKHSRSKKGANFKVVVIKDPSSSALELNFLNKSSSVCNNCIVIIFIQYYLINP